MSTRKFSRVRFRVEATITTGERQFQGEVGNLSMTGMFLVTEEHLADGEAVEIKIVLTGVVPLVSVDFSGRVSRTSGNGIGFVFEKIDLDSYMHLKNIVVYNSADVEKVMEEISADAEKVMEEIRHSIDEKPSLKK